MDDRKLTEYTNLHSHSMFSLLDGMSSIDKLVELAVENKMKGLAVTDHGNLIAAIEHYKTCKKYGINPIIGEEFYMAKNSMQDKDRDYYHLILMAQNYEGYKNLLYLTTKANLDGYYYKPRIDHDLLSQHSEGLICTSTCLSGEVAEYIKNDDYASAKKIASWYKDLFGDNYYAEIQNNGIELQNILNRNVIQIAKELDIKVVCTNDNHYSCQEDHTAHELLLCIQTGSNLSNPNRFKFDSDLHYLRTPEEMLLAFKDIPESLKNTMEINEKCNVIIPFGRINFPKLDFIPTEMTPDEYLSKVCWQGLYTKYGIVGKEVTERLKYELDVVKTTGFASYILFVWDFVKWARDHDIMCGPRGSAAGSIILYCLNISTIDPISHGLTFERFLNPERIQMPDIDMDFADSRRQEVIDYISNKYGYDHVAQIITINRMQAKAAIRDTGRVLEYSIPDVDRIAKLIPTIPVGMTIEKSINAVSELRQIYENEPDAKRLIDTAMKLEGTAKSAGVHAAGVVVSGDSLINHVPLQQNKEKTSIVSQYEMHALEDIGLLKMDFLGLSNLTLLERTLRLIKDRHGIDIDIHNLPIDDPKTFEMLSRGESTGVFQLEGGGMRNVLKQFQPTSVHHLAAIVALYRPGPMDYIPQYVAAKNGTEPITYLHPALEPILKDTYGIMVYQDQVLLVLQKIAGYSMGKADIVRKAMGKKIKEEMAKEKEGFLKGAHDNKIPDKVASQIWERIEPFAGYGFNRAHAYCYGYIALQTAYLKANYPIEFMTAMLTTESDNIDKLILAIGESRKLGIDILIPDVNKSNVDFSIENNSIRYGLGALKGVEVAAGQIVSEREKNGEFKSLDDICKRINARSVNKKIYSSLIKSGAMDSFDKRHVLLYNLENKISAWGKVHKAADIGQQSFLDMFDPISTDKSIENIPVPTVKELSIWEKEALGFYLTNHPFFDASVHLMPHTASIGSLLNDPENDSKVSIAGSVMSVKKIVTKKGDPMAVLQVEDMFGSIEVVVFPKNYNPNICVEDKILMIDGKVGVKSYNGVDTIQIVADNLREWKSPADNPKNNVIEERPKIQYNDGLTMMERIRQSINA